MFYILFGKKVSELRKKFNLTQEEVCEKSGISIGTLRKIENGKGNITIDSIEKLSKIYKTDLFLVLSESRNYYDILSSKFIDDLTILFQEQENVKINDEINKLILYLKESMPDHESSKLITLLVLLKNIHYIDVRFMEHNIYELEKLLDEYNTTKSLNTEPVLYYIELFIIIYLSSIHRKLGNFEQALNLLIKSRNCILNKSPLSLRDHNFIGTLTISICYVYHRQDMYTNIIEEVTSLLSNNKFQFSRYILTELEMRVAISYILLGKEDIARHYLTSLYIYEKENRKESRIDLLFDKYNFDINKYFSTN